VAGIATRQFAFERYPPWAEKWPSNPRLQRQPLGESHGPWADGNEEIVLLGGGRVGNPVSMWAAPRRDGMGGASFASARALAPPLSRSPRRAGGCPFLEKGFRLRPA